MIGATLSGNPETRPSARGRVRAVLAEGCRLGNSSIEWPAQPIDRTVAAEQSRGLAITDVLRWRRLGIRRRQQRVCGPGRAYRQIECAIRNNFVAFLPQFLSPNGDFSGIEPVRRNTLRRQCRSRWTVPIHRDATLLTRPVLWEASDDRVIRRTDRDRGRRSASRGRRGWRWTPLILRRQPGASRRIQGRRDELLGPRSGTDPVAEPASRWPLRVRRPVAPAPAERAG